MNSSSVEMVTDAPQPENISFLDAIVLANCLQRCEHPNPTVDIATALLKRHPSLRALVAKYIKTSDDGPLFASKHLKGPFSPPEDLIIAAEAWNIEYKGDNAKLFVETINHMNTTRPRLDYDHYITIVQSSGTGKSRTVDEAAKSIFTLPFNLRSRYDYLGFPPPDKEIRDSLSIPTDTFANDLHLRYIILFTQIFLLVREEIQSLSTQSHEDLALVWYNMLQKGNYREELYDRACKKFRDEVNKNNNYGDVASRSSDALEELLDVIAQKSGKVHKKGSSSRQPQPVRLMMYFDESQDLLYEYTKGGPYHSVQSAYQVLRTTFGSYSGHDIFIVYLSTKPFLYEYSPPKKVYPSARDATGPIQPADSLQAPFVELPFDNFPEPIVEEDKMKLSDVSMPDHMVKFGRPLFWTRWRSSDEKARHSIFDFAMVKLLGSSRTWGTTKGDGRLAAASIRLMFDFEMKLEEAKETACRFVSRHMRMVFSISKYQEYLYSGTPSEPVLAEAAARIMNDPGSGGTLAIISRVFDNGLISTSERVELVARLLLTLARDRCVRGHVTSEAYFSQPILVSEFLEALVGNDHMKKIFNARPDNIPNGVTFMEAFKEARINFTHFVKGDGGSIVTDKAAWLALVRCMAYRVNFEPMFDMYIPVSLWDKALGRWVVTGIFIQIKDRLKQMDIDIDLGGTGFFSPGGGHAAETRPYITLTMEFGFQPPNPSNSKTKIAPNQLAPSTCVKATTPTKFDKLGEPGAPSIPSKIPIANDLLEEPKSKHPRYAISIVGCSSTVYDVIQKEEEDTYTRFLSSQDIIHDHPRQDSLSIDSVLRMKPYWSKGANSHNWAKFMGESRLNAEKEMYAQQEGVFVSEWSISNDDEWEE